MSGSRTSRWFRIPEDVFRQLDEAVKAIGSNVTGVQGDVAKLADLDRLYETVKAEGRIDIVLANANSA
jgi:NAD(P)-dependent dehydrogenase (short-subunit alcohol dehydrogenase family)